jgi:hypothetical protein
MPKKQPKSVLRLRKRHAPGSHATPVAADGERLVRAQSLRQAFFGGLVVVIAFAIIWSMLTSLLDRVLPFMTLALGLLVGWVVRRAGLGLDWRFPALAAALAFGGAILGNVVIAAANTAGEFDTGTLNILLKATRWTWPIFFDEVMTAADFIYAFSAAGIAAFYANRRLTRSEFQALRIWQERGSGST